MFTLLKIAQQVKQVAETWSNTERIMPKLGCNPFRLGAKLCRFRFYSQIVPM